MIEQKIVFLKLNIAKHTVKIAKSSTLSKKKKMKRNKKITHCLFLPLLPNVYNFKPTIIMAFSLLKFRGILLGKILIAN